MIFPYKTKQGFTLIEILVAVAVVGVIIGFGMTIDLSSLRSDTFQAEETTIVSALQKARSRSMANMYESVHGFCYIAPNYILFRGRTTCLPTSGTDETIPANINIASNASSSFPTFVFTQLSGTTTGATIHITDGTKSDDIIINNEGTINW